MSKNVTYFPRTTVQQRYLLFETWEATGSVTAACRQARLTRKVFYTWKPRFDAGGYAALDMPYSHAPKHPPTIPAAVAKQVIRMKRAHPTWGKRRIADELAKANSWVPVVSVNTVKRILQEANLWPETDRSQKKNASNLGFGQLRSPARVSTSISVLSRPHTGQRPRNCRLSVGPQAVS